MFVLFCIIYSLSLHPLILPCAELKSSSLFIPSHKCEESSSELTWCSSVVEFESIFTSLNNVLDSVQSTCSWVPRDIIRWPCSLSLNDNQSLTPFAILLSCCVGLNGAPIVTLVYSETNKAQNELSSCLLIKILFVKRNHSALFVNYSIFSLQLKVEIMRGSCYIRSVCINLVGKYNML
jgi:hypothetical protein